MTKARQAKEPKEHLEPPLPNPSSRWSRLAFTIVPVVVFLLAQQVMLPGVDAGAFAGWTGSTDQYNIVGLGIQPVISAALLVEIVAVLVPRWRHLRHGGAEGRAKLLRATTILAVVLAVFQGYAVNSVLQGPPFAAPGGILPALLITMTLVAGAMLAKLLADMMSHRGLASGYGVFIGVFAVVDVGYSIRNLARSAPTPMEVLGFAGQIAGAAALTWFVLERMRPRKVELVGQKQDEGATSDSDALNPYAAPQTSVETKPAEQSKASSLHLPIPASGIGPYTLVGTLLAFPMTFALVVPGAAALADLLENKTTEKLVSIWLLFSLTWYLAWLFNQPRRVAEVYARLRGTKVSKAHVEAEAREALRHATPYALLYLLGLLVIDFAAKRSLLASVNTWSIAIAVALSIDLVTEFQALGLERDLVSVWPEHRPYAIAAARKALEDAGIFVHVRDERQRRLLQFGAPYVPMEIFVARKDARRAAKILNDLLLAKPEFETDQAEESASQPLVLPRRRSIAKGVVVMIALLTAAGVVLSLPVKKTAVARQPRTTKLEFVLVDDEHSIAEESANMPIGLVLSREQVSNGLSGTAVRRFAEALKTDYETLEDARERLEAWTKTLTLPEGDRVAIGEFQGYDEDNAGYVVIGWRTYLLKGSAILTEADVATARAMRDPNTGEWLARLEFTDDGAKRFEKFTAENIKRRLAILLDGRVQSAPVIQTKIPGGIATITMGTGSQEKQMQDARNLEKALNGE
ncbi:MAG: DUF2007 domain-containing protein [Polyangiaceae bacterium]|nr:DUF2007 domain-containing protein [Polyangiaceae bacterium]